MEKARIALPQECSGCGACAYVCPKSCIKMIDMGEKGLLPTLDETDCIDCGRCTKTCPVMSPSEKSSQIETFAAWNSDDVLRQKSASGGAATAFYQSAIKRGWLIVGAEINQDLSVSMRLRSKIEDVASLTNSKYVFSNMTALYPELKEALSTGDKVVFIGIPCQIAAVQRTFKRWRNQMILVDLVCHGTNSQYYLNQHIKNITQRCGVKAESLSFRQGPKFNFQLKDSADKIIYEEGSWYRDMYQLGYHRGLFYRENCYHCPYASSDRVSDITLKDYWGLGDKIAVNYPRERVVAVLVNTQAGKEFVRNCVDDGFLVLHSRPIEEPIEGDNRLKCPTPITEYRERFIANVKATSGDFTQALLPIAKELKRNQTLDRYKRLPKMTFYKYGSIVKQFLRKVFR